MSVEELTIEMLCNEIEEATFIFEEMPYISAAEWKEMIRLARSHDLLHLLGDIVKKNDFLLDKDIRDNLIKSYYSAIYRYKLFDTEFNAIVKILTEAKIEFLPLKGIVIRDYYPKPWMRSFSDIDILVHQEDLKIAEEVLSSKLHYSFDNVKDHDVTAISSNGVHLELHFQLKNDSKKFKWNIVLDDVWNYTIPGKTAYCKQLSNEMLYFYHIAHMAKHFVQGGCGVRPFMDLWVITKKMQIDNCIQNKLLETAGLTFFAHTAEELTKKWFKNETVSDQAVKMERFVLASGLFGTNETQLASRQIWQNGKIRDLFRRIWVPYNHLCILYPDFRRKKKVLLPIYELKRWRTLLDSQIRKRSIDEVTKSFAISSDRLTELNELYSEMKLF